MSNIMSLTNWKITPPKPYGVFHLTFLILGIIISVLLARKLKKLNDKQNKKLLFGVGIFLLVIEVYKELFYYYVVNNETYDFSIFPFQLCDIPMFICLLIPFIKNKKVLDVLYNFMMSYNFLGAFITFLEPSSLCRPYLMMTIHGFLWHIILLFLGIYLFYSNRGLKKIKDFKLVIGFYGILCVIAIIINISLRNVTNGKLNAFYLGPAPSQIIVFRDIYNNFGWVINAIIFILAMTFASYMIYVLFYHLREMIKNHEN